MSDEVQQAQKMSEKLNSISPAFCLVRWKHATLNFAAGASKSCCHLPFRTIQKDEFRKDNQLHDNDIERDERRRMLNGEKVESCSYCWWIEKQGHLSDRHIWSNKQWMAPYFSEVTKDLSAKAQNPTWLELNFSSLCNLKCSYCSPIYSSRWYKEIKEFGPYPTAIAHNDIKYLNHIEYQEGFDNTELMGEFWIWFEKVFQGLHLLKITGGEPFLSPHTTKMLEIIKRRSAPQLSLAINSNFCPPEEKWQKFLTLAQEIENNQSVQEIYMHPSIDSWGKRAEYIRHGLDLNLMKARIESFLAKTKGHIFFICTTNNLSLAGLLDFWKYLLYLKQTYQLPNRTISVTTEVLLSPRWQNINILPEYFVTYVEEVIEFVKQNLTENSSGFNSFELQGLLKAKSSMRSHCEDLEGSRRDFFRFFSEHDRRRKTNFLSVFPELKEFWRECEELEKTPSSLVSPEQSREASIC